MHETNFLKHITEFSQCQFNRNIYKYFDGHDTTNTMTGIIPEFILSKNTD